jgi:phosphoglycerate dehydrogenase-like enzyme
VVIFGLGDIGKAIAKFCKNFEMNVIGIKRDTNIKSEYTDKLLHTSKFHEAVKEADFLVISSSLNEETNHIIDKKVFNNMKETSYLINVARGGCVNEQDLIEALNNNKIKGAALDHLSTEPLDINNPLWDFENVIITPHTAGETPNYETVIPEILIENIENLKNDNDNLLHRVV